MEVDRFHLDKNCDYPIVCFVTGICYSAFILHLDTEIARDGAVLDAFKHLKGLGCKSVHCTEQRRMLEYFLKKNTK